MNFLSILVFASLLFGCASHGGEQQRTLAELASDNQTQLTKISLGMSKSQVFAIMGNSTVNTHDGVVNNPWSTESFVGKDGGQYEILFYIIRKNQPFTPVRKSLATEIVLKDGKVNGWGESASQQYKLP